MGVQDDAPEGLCSKLSWIACNKVHRRAVGSKNSEGKVFLRCYHEIPLYDLDMLMPGASPNPKLFDLALVGIPFLFGFGVGVYKVYEVRPCAVRSLTMASCAYEAGFAHMACAWLCLPGTVCVHAELDRRVGK